MAEDLVRIAAQKAATVAASIDVAELAERIGLRAVAVVSELHQPEDKDLEQLTVEAALPNVQAVLGGSLPPSRRRRRRPQR